MMAKRKADSIFFDSNVFVDALRSTDFELRIERFLQGAFLYSVSKVVLMELWAGARTKYEMDFIAHHEKTFPLLDLPDDCLIEAGKILAKLRSGLEGEALRRRRLTWDLLIALSARENRAVLVTQNLSDFRRIQDFVEFELMTP